MFNIQIDNCISNNIKQTQKFADELKKHLESRFPDFEEIISMVVTDSMDKCPYLNTKDIGFVNTTISDKINAYEVYLSGKNSGIKLSADNIKNFITGLIGDYKLDNKNTNTFKKYIKTIIKELEC